MKTLAQLLEISKNPYYTFTNEEQKVLDDFLYKNSEQRKLQKNNLKNSKGNTPAIVHNKNVVHKDTGVLPTTDQV